MNWRVTVFPTRKNESVLLSCNDLALYTVTSLKMIRCGFYRTVQYIVTYEILHVRNCTQRKLILFICDWRFLAYLKVLLKYFSQN